MKVLKTVTPTSPGLLGAEVMITREERYSQSPTWPIRGRAESPVPALHTVQVSPEEGLREALAFSPAPAGF